MNNNNNNSVKLATYRRSYIVAGVLFAIIFILSMTLFGLVTYEASGIIANLISTAAFFSALIIAGITSVRCSMANRIKNPGDIFIPKRDAAYYFFKRIGFFSLMIVLMSLAASMVGWAATSLIGGIFFRIEHAFLSEFLLKLPVFILYLSLVYKMLVRFGFMDSQRKIFNPNIKMIAFMIAFIIMIPGLVSANYFYVPALNGGLANVQTVLSPCSGTYIIEYDGYITMNENFWAGDAILIGATVLLTFLIQALFFRFAYNRGKKIFIKQHIREVDEYSMDENI